MNTKQELKWAYRTSKTVLYMSDGATLLFSGGGGTGVARVRVRTCVRVGVCVCVYVRASVYVCERVRTIPRFSHPDIASCVPGSKLGLLSHFPGLSLGLSPVGWLVASQ